MKLRPHEILKYLGFDVPEEGVEINPNDAFLAVSALRLAGETIDVSRVDAVKLIQVHRGVTGIAKGWVDSGLVSPMPIDETSPSPDRLQKLAMMLDAVLDVSFRHRKS